MQQAALETDVGKHGDVPATGFSTETSAARASRQAAWPALGFTSALGRGEQSELGSRSRGGTLPNQAAHALPPISPLLLVWFTWYARRHLRRHFHSLRISKAVQPPANLHLPLVVYSNHASWWDPLVGLVLAREFLSDRAVYAPMDAAALERYSFFKRLGMFGVEQGTRRGAVQFRRMACRILAGADRALWLTPQSRFADVRERPVAFKGGIGHLPNLAPRVCFLPVAIEYVFWEERLPEILVRFGGAYETDSEEMKLGPEVMTEFFAGRLAEAQDHLAVEARQRRPERFCCLLRGRAGVGGVYDRWRSLQAKWRGESFQPEHGSL